MAFTYRVEDNFRSGIPQTVFQYGAGPFRGISCHWTAGAPGRYGALGTVQFLIDNASRNASYHEIWWWENKTFGVMRIVRPERASHSMNPTPPTWSPNTIVRNILGDKVGDPNRYSYSVSFAGMPVDMDRALTDPDFIAAATRRIRELQAQFKLGQSTLYTHGEGQPSTRYGWGTVLRPKIYAVMATPPAAEEPNMLLRQVQQDWTTKGRHEFWTQGPGLGEKKFCLDRTMIRTHFEEAIRGADGVLRTGSWRVFSINGEGLWIHRDFIDPQDNTRVPATGYGPVPSGDTAELERVIREQTNTIAGLKTDLGTSNERINQKNAKADELK